MSIRFNGLPIQPARKKRRDPLAWEVSLFARDLLNEFLKMRSEEKREAERRRQPEFIIENALIPVKAVRQMAETLLSARPVDPRASVIPAKAKKRGGRRRGKLNRQTIEIQEQYKIFLAEFNDNVRAKALTQIWLADKKGIDENSVRGKKKLKKALYVALKSIK
jgi:hypothetical protein